MPPAQIRFNSLPMGEALKYWKSKVPMQSKVFYSLADEYRTRAFTVSRIAQMDKITAVHKSVAKSLAKGESFEQWRKGSADIFKAAGWTGNNRHRLDTIYRNNIQAAYGAGRWHQSQEAKRYQPFGQYDTVGDDRVRPSHAAHEGKVFPLDHPFWRTWWPPNGHKCRCSVTTLSAADVESQGLKVEAETPKGGPDEGFAANPGLTPFQANLDKYPATIKQQFLEDATRQPLAQVRRYLKQSDLEDLDTVVWAQEQGGVRGFDRWATGVVEAGEAHGTVCPVGSIPASVLAQVEAQPRLALFVMPDRVLLKLAADGSLGAGELSSIGKGLTGAGSRWSPPTAVRNTVEVIPDIGGRQVEMRIALDRKFGRGPDAGVANEIVSATVRPRE